MCRVFLILAMFTIVACGGDDDNPVSGVTGSGVSGSGVSGRTCTVGMVLDIGQSCTYDGGTFGVDANDIGCAIPTGLDGNTQGHCSNRLVMVNGFSASPVEGTSTWRIDSLP